MEVRERLGEIFKRKCEEHDDDLTVTQRNELIKQTMTEVRNEGSPQSDSDASVTLRRLASGNQNSIFIWTGAVVMVIIFAGCYLARRFTRARKPEDSVPDLESGTLELSSQWHS